MPERVQQARPQPKEQEQTDTTEAVVDKKQALKDEMDELLDEIDAVLEENAEEFVKQYVQKGGQ